MAGRKVSSFHITDLCPEVLELIFCYLEVRDKGRVSQVCKKWRDVAYSRSVWRNVEAKLHVRCSLKRKHSNSSTSSSRNVGLTVTACNRDNDGRCPTLYASLVKRGISRVQVLSLKHNLSSLIVGIPQLVSLNLSGCFSVTDKGLFMAFYHDMPYLRKLNLSLCKQVTDKSLGYIAQKLKNLEDLQLGGTYITNKGLMAVSFGLKQLKSLSLRGCKLIMDLGIAYISGQEGGEMCGNPCLEYLSLQDCQKITDDGLEYISAGLCSLKTIDLSFCANVTDGGIRFLSKMPSLRELNLRRCNTITDTGLRHLAGIHGLSVSPLSALDVSFCEKVGDQGLAYLSELTSLQSLSLCSCDITDKGIADIVDKLHNLTTLNIGQCTRISDESLALISVKLQQLTSIDLYGCTSITTAGLEKIMKLPSLSSLNLGLWHKEVNPNVRRKNIS